MTTWRAFWLTVACLIGAIFIGPQPYTFLGIPVFHIIGIVLALLAIRFFVKFTTMWKRDLSGKQGSQAMLAQRRAEAPAPNRTSRGSSSLSFNRPDE